MFLSARIRWSYQVIYCCSFHNLRFTGNVKLKGVIVCAPDDESHPARIRL